MGTTSARRWHFGLVRFFRAGVIALILSGKKRGDANALAVAALRRARFPSEG